MTAHERFIAAMERHGSPVTGKAASCPAHDDRNASLAVSEGDGKLVVTCHAGCSYGAIMRAVGLSERDGFDDARVTPRPVARPTAPAGALPGEDQLARYAEALFAEDGPALHLHETRGWTADAMHALGVGWDAASGRIVFPVRDGGGSLAGVVRYMPGGKPKTMAAAGSARGLFPAPETLPADGPVWIVEGEPDAVAAHSIGLAAVAVPGANKWAPEWGVRFAGRTVVVCVDCDQPGRQAAERIAAEVRAHAASVTVVDLDPTRTDGFDLTDAALAWGADARTRLDALASVSAEPVETATALDEVIAFLRRFVYLPSEDAYLALGLWVLHTHAFSAFARTPYLAVSSPERMCGKTQTLEVLESLTARAWKIDGTPSEAVIFRKIEAARPTLLLDEVDQLFKVGDQRVAALVGMLNSGYRKGATVPRCVGEGASMDTKDFSVYCPKALAGIDASTWPDTLVSRCIPIRLHRLPAGHRVDRWRSDRQEQACEAIRTRLGRWADQVADLLAAYETEVEELSPRAEEVWEPLLAIAALAGREDEARATAVRMSAPADSGVSIGALLLGKLRDIFGERPAVSTADILIELNSDDTLPFGGWSDGRGLSSRDLARHLAKYGVKPTTVRIGASTPKGYRREDVAPQWATYAPLHGEAPHPPHPQHPNVHGGFEVADGGRVADVAHVADISGGAGGQSIPLWNETRIGGGS